MDIITVDGKQYDPYFILDVTRDDSSSHITQSFRTKIKKYHPDKYTDLEKKQKYEKYFKILTESYQYIKNKRESYKINKRDHKTQNKHTTKNEVKQFNKEFDEKNDTDPNSYGYGDSYNRLERLEDYDKLDIDICNQFCDKKFSNEEFNDIFEYMKKNDKDYDKVVEKSLIHKTTDGFRGYNSSDFGNCALVSSFNGLMVTGDMFGENGVGYWGAGYSDYKYSYQKVKNPNSKIIAPKVKRDIKKISEQDINEYKKRYNIKVEVQVPETPIDKIIYDDLVEKEREDEILVKKFISQYDTKTVKDALSGNLDKCQRYRTILERQYIKHN